jgi:hypothetical protein
VAELGREFLDKLTAHDEKHVDFAVWDLYFQSAEGFDDMA